MSNVIRLKTGSVSVRVAQPKLQTLVHAQGVSLGWSEAARAARHLVNSIIAYRKAVDLLPETQERRLIQMEIDEMELQFMGLVSRLITTAGQTIIRTRTILASSEKR